MGKHTASVDNQVLARLQQRGPGWVFTPADFADLGSPNAVRIALTRHKQAGRIRQLGRGLYDLPREGRRVAAVAPPIEAVADAIKTRDAVRLQPSGAYAAHLLGLTEQVPMRVSFLTDGPAREIKLGRMTISLRRTTPRNMASAGRSGGLVIQALRWLGREKVDAAVIKRLRTALPPEERRQLADDARHAPAWVAAVMRQIAQT